MFDFCLEKQEHLKKMFDLCRSQEAIYEKIIELGQQQVLLDNSFKVPENLVQGCQSRLYLRTYTVEGKIFFEADSDALISSGLAALLTLVYSGETPEVVLKCPPTYLEALGIHSSITPSRANGLYSVHLRMKQEALKLLVEQQTVKR